MWYGLLLVCASWATPEMAMQDPSLCIVFKSAEPYATEELCMEGIRSAAESEEMEAMTNMPGQPMEFRYGECKLADIGI